MNGHLKVNSELEPVAGSEYGEFVELITAVKTIDADDNGKTFILSAAAGVAVTLPALKSGLNFRFITGLAFATTDWTIVAATNVIQGNAIVAGADVPAVNENTISFVASAESLGDHVDLVCDGTNWYARGSGVTAGSITFTAP